MDHSSGSPGDTECRISMMWNWHVLDSCFLGNGWHIKNKGMFAVTCLGVIAMVVLLEALRRLSKEYDLHILREWQSKSASIAAVAAKNRIDSTAVTSETTCCGEAPESDAILTAAGLKERSKVDLETQYALEDPESGRQNISFQATPAQQVIRAVIHALMVGLAYIVMLLVMSYNGYIFISVVIGAGLGKFFCDWMKKRVIVGKQTENSSHELLEPTVCCG